MNVIALVTIYNPVEKNIYNIKLISEQVTEVIVLNNTPLKTFSPLFSSMENVFYFDMERNLGLSSAFNFAMNLEQVIKSDFIIFFDQDSTIREKHVSQLIEDFECLEKKEPIGLLGPKILDKNRGKIFTSTEFKNENFYERVEELITSSLLTRYSILKKVNFWNDEIFLDFADYDLCWRLNRIGMYSYLTNNVILEHFLGEGIIQSKFLWKNLEFSYSKPLREYYQNRAAVKLLKKSYVSFRWKKNFIFNLIFRIRIFCKSLEDSKMRKTFYRKGVIDGLLNKSGELVLKEN